MPSSSNYGQLLNELVSTNLSTVAAHSLVGQGLSCFSPVIIAGSDNYSAFYFGQLIDGLLNLGWVKGSDVEAARAEFHALVREQHQIEHIGNLRVPINDVFSFCCGFRSRHLSYQVSILPENSFLTLVFLRYNTFYVLSFQCNHIPVLVY